MIYFELIFVECELLTKAFTKIMMSKCSNIFVENTILSSLNCFGAFVKSQLTIFVWVYFWVLYSLPLTYVSIALYQYLQP